MGQKDSAGLRLCAHPRVAVQFQSRASIQLLQSQSKPLGKEAMQEEFRPWLLCALAREGFGERRDCYGAQKQLVVERKIPCHTLHCPVQQEKEAQVLPVTGNPVDSILALAEGSNELDILASRKLLAFEVWARAHLLTSCCHRLHLGLPPETTCCRRQLFRLRSFRHQRATPSDLLRVHLLLARHFESFWELEHYPSRQLKLTQL